MESKAVSRMVETTGGTQAIRRAVLLLREVAAVRGGASLTGLAAATGLSTSTVHRTLAALTEEGMLAKDERSRRYRAGPLLHALGLAAAAQPDVRRLVRPVLERLAEASGDTAYANLRSGADALCVDCCEGSFPIRALPMRVGNRRPLGMGAASIAVLGTLPAAEAAEVVVQNAPRLARAGLTPELVAAALRSLRVEGWVVTSGRLGAQYRGVAVPVADPGGRVGLALSISAVAERLGPKRVVQVAQLLQREARGLARELAGVEG